MIDMKKFILPCVLTIISASIVSCSMAEDGVSSFPGNYTSDGNTEIDGNSGDNFKEIKENDFVEASAQPTSTFSVDADGATYAYMRACIKRSCVPDPRAVRIEEYLNYFTFDYAEPEGEESVAINAELGACPWNKTHKLLRLGLKGKSMKDSEIPDANFIFLIDVSGSMMGEDRLDLVKTGLCTMVDYMKPSDRIAIITYSGEVRKVLESTLVKDAAGIKNAIKSLSASGYTSGGAAMKMAYEEATEHYMKGGNNRIIMCTDGDFNVGVSSTEALVEMVESYLDKGIYLSIMGFGMGNYQDSRMEEISNHGNGTYNYIDSEEEMMKVFVGERSRFYSVANDTKCQVSFDPAAVGKYRLIGYENRVMNNEDFENDKKDAGEIGAGQTITALYEIIPAEGYVADALLCSFDVRYKKALGEDSRNLGLKLKVPAEDSDSENIRFASGVAAYGLCLRNSEYKGEASLDMAAEIIGSARDFDPNGLRKQLCALIGKIK